MCAKFSFVAKQQESRRNEAIKPYFDLPRQIYIKMDSESER